MAHHHGAIVPIVSPLFHQPLVVDHKKLGEGVVPTSRRVGDRQQSPVQKSEVRGRVTVVGGREGEAHDLSFSNYTEFH